MLCKLARKTSSFLSKFFVLYLFSFSVVYSSHFEKIYNIQNQKKIKDISFDLEVSNLKKKLEPHYPLKSLEKFKINIVWINDGSFDILLESLPRGNKSIERNLKLQVLDIVKILFPTDKIKELKKRYNIKREKNKLIAINNSYNRRKIVIDLDKEGLIKKIESFFPLNKIIEIYEYKKIDDKFFIDSRLEKNSAYKDNYSKKVIYNYKKIKGSNLPTKIEIIEEIKTKINQNSKEVKRNQFKSYYLFKNYKINKGIAKSHFDRTKRKENE